jgi:hypothetical protein
MFSAIVDALKTIINLKSEANRDKKTILEIKNLEDARREKTSGISPASFDQVRYFDPKVREIDRQFMPATEHREIPRMTKERARRSRLFASFVLIFFSILILYAVVRLILWLVQ